MLDARATDEVLLAESFERDVQGLSPAERRAELLVGAAFVAATIVLLLASGGRGDWHALPALCALAAMALAMHARFDVGSGFTPPTQIAVVPLLFSAPPAAVPLLTALALALARVPDVARGDVRPSRLALSLGNSWFAVGPAVVLLVYGDPGPLSASPGLVGALLLAQFGVDFAVSYVRERMIRPTTVRAELRLAAPVYAVDLALAPVGVLAALAVERESWAVLCLLPLLALFAVFARERRGRLTHMLELNSAYRGTALALGDVVQADDGYTGEHSRGVVALATEVGRRLGLRPEQIRNLEFGALLHDVGKVAIPKSIINKPGKLDPDEWTLVKTHTIEGQRMLDRIGGFMAEVGLVIRSHHERWDGSGYPDGLAGEAIPIEARVITACDSWNAMRTDRPYRTAMSVEAAREEMRRNSGTQFDPACVAALLVITAGETEAGLLAAPTAA
jgi:HD-GYP domain-containing protein (c-di-GMP phosphodiesterase class II)